MNLRPEAAPTFPRQPILSLPYLLHPCSRLPLGEGGPKGQVRERPPVHGYNSWQRRGQAVSPIGSSPKNSDPLQNSAAPLAVFFFRDQAICLETVEYPELIFNFLITAVRRGRSRCCGASAGLLLLRR